MEDIREILKAWIEHPDYEESVEDFYYRWADSPEGEEFLDRFNRGEL